MFGIPQVAPEDAKDAVEEGAVIIDVREAHEWAAARIPGALHVPLSRFQERFGDIPTDRPLILQCASGMRSLSATRFLRQQGLDARNLAGGIQNWAATGLPVESGPSK